MPNYYKPKAPLELKLQAVEAAFNQQGLKIQWGHRGLEVSDNQGNRAYIRDTESPDIPSSLPRAFDSERLQLPEGS